jgi:AraC family transcriptional regulator, alkane utilization regulator
VDELSELLHSFRLGGSAFIDATLTAPWSIQTPTAAELGRQMGAISQHIIPYHYVSEGTLVAQLANGASETVEKGEAIVFPHGDVHLLASEPGLSPLRITTETVVRLIKTGAISQVKYGGGGATTGLICGFFACDLSLSERFINPLPAMFKFRVPDDSAASLLPLAVRRSQTSGMSDPVPGNAGILCKLSELLSVEALRACVDRSPDLENGWVAGVKDPVIGKTLSLIHAQPGRGWTSESLADAVGVSRTTLCDRFIHRLQQTPIQYLMSWRLRLAANSITRGNLMIKQVAAEAGFSSTAAFSRAFKRELGSTPSEWARRTISTR